MSKVRSLLGALLALICVPVIAAAAAIALALADLIRGLMPNSVPPASDTPRNRSASVVIPNWNGRDLLEKYLPSVLKALEGDPDNELIVVDNGSSDGSADLLRERFPRVRVLALDRNLGFGGGSNAGFRAAKNDIVVLLNNDMRVAPDFLQPLLDGFTDPLVFSAACQIFFSDPAKVRQETGLTQVWWAGGNLRVRHRQDDAISGLYPCAYGGGGSCAYDRRKFLELGGFDELLAPFYMEDTDLGYLAWKRGWKVLYQPKSHVWHEHRGTIGKRFSDAYIQGVLNKNYILFAWKNVHDWRMLLSHFLNGIADSALSAGAGHAAGRLTLAGHLRAIRQLPAAIRSRWRARALAVLGDREALRRPLGGYFRDVFERLQPEPPKPSVLFVSPYPITPPIHGGAVFMSQTIQHLAGICDLHLIVLLDYENELAAHQELKSICASAEFLVRLEARTKALGSVEPHAVREFRSQELEWLIHRQIYTRKVDLLQLEYTVLAQYGGNYRQIPSILFEHDVYFQSIARQLPGMNGLLRRIRARYEYLRAIRFELTWLPRMDRVQVCSADNGAYLQSFLPRLAGKIDDDLRAGIDTTRYAYHEAEREPGTMLFLGSFRHLPNQEGLRWLFAHVLPIVHRQNPRARLLLVGSEPPPRHALPHTDAPVELVGFVEDVREPLAKYALFLCPILSGSGVRVKLLEAFAAGIPVVSTGLGAEGLAAKDGEICALADTPEDFAARILDLLADPPRARLMARRAREYVIARRDMGRMTARLLESYRTEIRRKRMTQ
ncbi:MAG: glycosyltransferase [Bryobacteraceae bacterium]|nr:glycosyltransferase [Bryobacteraceae bacterium]